VLEYHGRGLSIRAFNDQVGLRAFDAQVAATRLLLPGGRTTRTWASGREPKE
jgi:hypothetical protein